MAESNRKGLSKQRSLMANADWTDLSNKISDDDLPVEQFEEEDVSGDVKFSRGGKPAPQNAKPAIESESVVVHQAEVLTFVVLLYSAAGLGVAVSLLTKKNTEDEYRNAFGVAASSLIQVTESRLSEASSLLKTLSASFDSFSRQGDDSYPFVTYPDFVERTQETLLATNSSLLTWCPLVPTEDLDEWHLHSQTHLDWALSSDDTEMGSVEWLPVTPSDAVSDDGYLAPQWQFAPIEDNQLNKNRFASASFTEAAQQVIERDDAVLSRTVSSSSSSTEMSMLVPSHARTDDGRVVGMLELHMSWKSVFQGAVPNINGPLYVEMDDLCGSKFSYFVDADEVSFAPGTKVENDDRSLQTELEVFGTGDCRQIMTVYPTNAFRGAFDNRDAAIYTTMVLAVFFFMIVAFLVYAWTVRNRQKTVKSTIDKTTAIVASIFPENVQDRIYNEAKRQVEEEAKMTGPTKSVLQSLAKDINGHSRSAAGKPIADLFTECTIMFADIVGFTAWSSTREPSQVFTLLEHIYRHFDEIAARRRVFKVETVGDCFAVAGLPEPRKDHAVAMARFANDCMLRFNGLVQQLTVELGPDTEDLSIRIGMHSGPVTAGVLRGERARFQLFGDTVNTTARMESSGRPNVIHVSGETAKLLRDAGKEQWLHARHDPVVAKGKGEMKTYWLDLHVSAEPTTSTPTVSSVGTDSDNGAEERGTGSSLTEMSIFNPEVKRATSVVSKDKKHMRLVLWNVDVLAKSLTQIILRRKATGTRVDDPQTMQRLETELMQNEKPLYEVKETVTMPAFKGSSAHLNDEMELPPHIKNQLSNYVQALSAMYNENPFHNFEHASHVTMSVTKLLSRIVAPDNEQVTECEATLHDHTYGITSDPLTQFAVVLSALIHDADHPGVPNSQLIQEHSPMAAAYDLKSMAEQNSVDLAWQLLMDPKFTDLRRAIYVNQDELLRFRQLIVNVVLATDIMDKELKTLRNKRWDMAFSEQRKDCSPEEDVNRKATIVLEHLIQASDVAHTMQHWHIYRKWNMRLFVEVYKAYKLGRGGERDPSEGWYQGEMGFLDFYVIPLAKKLKDCGVFGVSSDEYLNYATMNRAEWERRGQAIVEENIQVAKKELRALGHE